MNSVTGFVVSRRIKLKDKLKNLEERGRARAGEL